MIDKLNNLDLNLNKLEELDKKKFSSNNFKEENLFLFKSSNLFKLESIVSNLSIIITKKN